MQVNQVYPVRYLEVEFIRERLFFVFNTFSSSKLDKNDKAKRNINLSNPKNFIKAKKTIRIDDIEIKIDAETIKAKETFKYKTSTVLISEENFRHLKWSRAVKQLNEIQQCWIKFCYGNFIDYSNQVIICNYVLSEFEKEKLKHNFRIKQKNMKIIKALVFLAIQSAAFEIHSYEKRYKSCELANLSQKTAHYWSQYLNQKWNLLLKICFILDEESLLNVYRQKTNNK